MDPNGQPDPWEALVKRLIEESPALGGSPAPAAPLPMVPSAAPPAPSFAPNPIASFFAGMGKGGGALLPAIGEGMKAVQSNNATRAALLARGASEADINAALANPGMMQQLLASIFAPKVTKLGPNEALVSPQGREIYRNADKFIVRPEGADIFDPNTRQMVTESGPRLTPFEKNYTNYVREEIAAGRTPKTREEYDLSQRRAGATAVTVDMTGERAFEKEAASGQAKRYNELVEKSLDARNLLGDLSALRDISSYIPAGKEAELKLALGPWAELFGIPIKDLGGIQAYQAIVDKMAPRMRVPGSGATSDFDARQFLRSLPQLGNTPEGRAIISNTFEAIQQSYIAAGEIASRALSREITPKQAEQELRALPDPYTQWKAARGTTPSAPQPPTPVNTTTQAKSGTDANPATPSSFEEALRLPKGTIFIVPDGPDKGNRKVR